MLKWTIGLLATLLGGGALALVLMNPVTPPIPGEPAEPPAAAKRSIQGIGYVEPWSQVRALTPKSGGVVKTLHVHAGAPVKQGALILTLQDAKEITAAAVARATLERARAEAEQIKSGVNPYRILAAQKTVSKLREVFKHAAAEADRAYQLYASKATSQSDVDQAESRRLQAAAALEQAEAELQHLKNFVRQEDVAVAQAKVKEAEANLALAEQAVRDLQVTAPFDGVVLKVLKRPGEGVRHFELEPVVLFGDLSRLRVRAEIDERFVQDIQISQTAEIFGRNFQGKVYQATVAEIEKVMGSKTVFVRSAAERKDLDVLQVVLEVEPDFTAPVGLQVDVRLLCE